MQLLDAQATAEALPWGPLADAVERVLQAQARGLVQVPERSVLPIAPQTSWFLMPAWVDASVADLAMAKLITYNPGNGAHGLPAILGDVLVLRASSGERLALMDGPAVTGRRTAAVTAVAARRLAPQPDGPMLLIGAGVQARAHLEAFHALFGTREVWLRSRSAGPAQALLQHARRLGLRAEPADDLDAALARCTVVVTATSAQQVCLDRLPMAAAFVAAVGAFSPTMAELAPEVVRAYAERHAVMLDTASARHEAGDLLQAGVAVQALPALGDVMARDNPQRRDGVLFKSCGSALWDLAAALCLQQGVTREQAACP
jgi:ornithine cyclodeaminase